MCYLLNLVDLYIVFLSRKTKCFLQIFHPKVACIVSSAVLVSRLLFNLFDLQILVLLKLNPFLLHGLLILSLLLKLIAFFLLIFNQVFYPFFFSSSSFFFYVWSIIATEGHVVVLYVPRFSMAYLRRIRSTTTPIQSPCPNSTSS